MKTYGTKAGKTEIASTSRKEVKRRAKACRSAARQKARREIVRDLAGALYL